MKKAEQYAKTQVLTASPARLLVLLLRACRRNMAEARRHLENGDRKSAQDPINKASEIVYELCRTLDPQYDKALCDNLADVYANVSARLLRAQTTHDASHIKEAESLFNPVADAFEDVIEDLGDTMPSPDDVRVSP